MGSSSTFHGMHAIKQRQPHSNVADNARKLKRVAAKKPLLDELKAVLKDTPAIV